MCERFWGGGEQRRKGPPRIGLKFVSNHLETEKMCKHVIKKLHFVIRYAPDRYKTQQIVKFVPGC